MPKIPPKKRPIKKGETFNEKIHIDRRKGKEQEVDLKLSFFLKKLRQKDKKILGWASKISPSFIKELEGKIKSGEIKRQDADKIIRAFSLQATAKPLPKDAQQILTIGPSIGKKGKVNVNDPLTKRYYKDRRKKPKQTELKLKT